MRTYLTKVAKAWGSRISGWVLALIGLASLFATALVTKFDADPSLLNAVLFLTAGVSFLCCAWLWIRAHYAVWDETHKELEAVRKKHERPTVDLRFDEEKQEFTLVNSGGDAFQVNVIFASMGCHIELNAAPISKLAAHSTVPVTFVIATPNYEPKEGTTTYLLATRDRNELMQMCEVIFERVPSVSKTETFMIRYQDEDAVDYESECQIVYDPDGRHATVTLLRAQRSKPIVPLPFHAGGLYDVR
jgi:hypothetical protein